MQLGSDATATEMGRESNVVRCSKRNWASSERGV